MLGGTLANPWEFRTADFAGNAILVSLPWNAGTRALQNGTIQRDAGCLYSTLYIGFGGDGRIESSTQKIPVPAGGGGRTFAAGQLHALGLNTIDDVASSQITAAP